ncbi:MAG: chaperonin [Bacteroidetes bacterium HGW-Bacteroidetes-4]|jgi:co-chaperonin GroES (HSP10)|nr:MAG: chaperonin [Bacteroidetes bacterium HGW-Bacteroidetes-4]
MSIKLDFELLEKVLLVGDKLLIKPTAQSGKTKSGLYLPPGVQEKEKIQQGYILKVGPGYPIPALRDADETWKTNDDVTYIPLQAQVGDLAVFLQTGAYEIFFNNEKYYILPHASVLMLVRDKGLFQ